MSSPSIPYVLRLGEGGYYKAQSCLPALNLIQSTNVQLTTEPALLPNLC